MLRHILWFVESIFSFNFNFKYLPYVVVPILSQCGVNCNYRSLSDSSNIYYNIGQATIIITITAPIQNIPTYSQSGSSNYDQTDTSVAISDLHLPIGYYFSIVLYIYFWKSVSTSFNILNFILYAIIMLESGFVLTSIFNYFSLNFINCITTDYTGLGIKDAEGTVNKEKIESSQLIFYISITILDVSRGGGAKNIKASPSHPLREIFRLNSTFININENLICFLQNIDEDKIINITYNSV
ncbi:hypothetical protein AGLY_000145 [Aphis glycines]|uniref:Uncharacterized protein n=1 Tax=Aphis glycines TaxID=307491 RepID=A0A6G0U6N5_APHGL|nr:hypothetical protein AGLY_000145 [Aphis glycines]